MSDLSQQPSRKRQRRKESLVHFATKASKTSRALDLWDDALRVILTETNPFRFTASTTGSKKDQKEGKFHIDNVSAGCGLSSHHKPEQDPCEVLLLCRRRRGGDNSWSTHR